MRPANRNKSVYVYWMTVKGAVNELSKGQGDVFYPNPIGLTIKGSPVASIDVELTEQDQSGGRCVACGGRPEVRVNASLTIRALNKAGSFIWRST